MYCVIYSNKVRCGKLLDVSGQLSLKIHSKFLNMALKYLICSITELAINTGPNQKKGRYALGLRTSFA